MRLLRTSIFPLKYIAAFLLLSLTAQAQNKVIDQIAWVVGDEVILLSDIERQRIFMQQSGIKIDGDPFCVIPEQIAIQKLFLRQAKIDSIQIDESRVIQAAESWIKQKTNEVGGKERLEYLLGKNINDIREERRKAIREEYIVQQMQREIVGKIVVTPSEVNRFYEKVNKDSLPFMPETVETQIISLRPESSVEEVDKIKAKLRGYAKEVNSGQKDFAFLARLYSQDKATALKGGEMGFVGKAELEPEFANVAFSLPKSKVSRIVQTKKGYHIIQLIEKRDDLINLRHIMLRPRASDEAISAAITRLDSIRTQILADSLSFLSAATFYSYDEDTRNNAGIMVNNSFNTEAHLHGTTGFLMKDLPQEVGPIVDKLSVGEISKPFTMIDKNGNTVVSIVKLRKKNPGHRANVTQDYQVIKEFVTRKKQDELLLKWIKQKQSETYIKINDRWKNCQFTYPGWIKEKQAY